MGHLLERAWVVALPIALGACAESRSEPKAPVQDTASSGVLTAQTELFPKGRHAARGVVRFRVTDHGVLMKGRITGLSHGNFGFAIHERGDCSAPDGKSAGGYFNPTKTTARPTGQLDDVNADEEGVVQLNRVDKRLQLEGGQSILGKSLVVHAWAYDPGVDVQKVPYVACGVIEAE